MILSADELDILAYLKSSPGQYVSLGEISRRAGGRRRFSQSPRWAAGLMSRLVEAAMVEVNEHGYYRLVSEEQGIYTHRSAETAPSKISSTVVGEDYFPVEEQSRLVGDDYFPNAD